jgi:hypothetical protein
MPTTSDILGLSGLWNRSDPFRSLISSSMSPVLDKIASLRPPPEYGPNARYVPGAVGGSPGIQVPLSSQHSSQTTLGAWSNVTPTQNYRAETAGMPVNLAAAARLNLAGEDRRINRFNFTAGNITAPTVGAASTSSPQTAQAPQSFGADYQQNGVRVSGNTGQPVQPISIQGTQPADSTLADRIRNYRPQMGAYHEIRSQVAWGGAQQ